MPSNNSLICLGPLIRPQAFSASSISLNARPRKVGRDTQLRVRVVRCQHFAFRQITFAHRGALPVQCLDVLEPLQQRQQLRLDCLLNDLPSPVPNQFVQPQTDSR